MKRSFLLAGLILGSQIASAAGFEKSIMFGGQTSGVAGTGAGYMQGSQALYFNPAGLASDKVEQDISLNVSLIQSQFKGSVLNSAVQETSNSKLSTPVALMYGKTINDKLGLGVGFYTSAGSYADYNGKTITGIKGDFEAKTDLVVNEFAIGAGYKVMDNLKLGLAWRLSMANASLALPKQLAPTTFAQVNLDDLKDTNYKGFKFGAEYKLGDKTDLGFSYRSEVDFKAKGTQHVTAHNTVGVGATSSADVTVGTALPASWTLGAKHACTEDWNVFAEYNFVEYSKIDNISTDSGGVSSPIVLKMKDQHQLRLAGEYKGFGMPVRFGYIYSTQVTNNDYALATLTPPGVAHVVTVGTGMTFGLFRADAGFEYDMVKGTPTGVTAQNEVNAYSLHLGGTFTF